MLKQDCFDCLYLLFFSAVLSRFCCDKTPNEILQSEGDTMLVIFKAKDTFATSQGDRLGFKLVYYTGSWIYFGLNICVNQVK